MYEAFYNLTEKPFTLLPDPGFLYMSDKHRTAASLLEYGLNDHAGFTVISGEIGAGKTTLIRDLLNKMEQEFSVGLISNTHRSFGELLQWVLLAFNLEYKDSSKVEMYQRFVDFIIGEYANKRRTVLIIDEAQNMDAETLEELRMLSNINADKDQALQVILVGQRELRDTLRRPELVQFAQRITVDYHLESLSAAETAGYINHRMQVAGGNKDTFTPEACAAVHSFSNGVPRLINLICDTALIYGYAEQLPMIGPQLVTEVAREKQRSGMFPIYESAEPDSVNHDVTDTRQSTAQNVMPEALADESVSVGNPGTADNVQNTPPENLQPQASDKLPGNSVNVPLETEKGQAPATEQGDWPEKPAAQDIPQTEETISQWMQGDNNKKKLRVAICSGEQDLCRYLSRLLESYGFNVVAALPVAADLLANIIQSQVDVLLLDRDPTIPLPPKTANIIANWSRPVLYNDTETTRISLRDGNPDFGLHLSERIHSLIASSTSNMTASR